MTDLNIKHKFSISGFGYFLPPKVETSDELAKKINKSSDWIISRTGVKERRISEIDVDKMGAIAADMAIGEKSPPDLIINASGVPKQTIPDTSVFIQKELGYKDIPSFSVHATCLSFIVALNIAGALISSNSYDKILIVSADRGTRGRNFNEPESSSLLGDAAGALYVERNSNSEGGIISYNMQTYPEGSGLTEVRGGGTNLHPEDSATQIEDNLFSMNGPMVYKMARKKVYDMIAHDLSINNLNQSDIDLVVPHQASGMAVKAYSKFGGFNQNKVVDIISTTGNCVAASVPLALALSLKDGIVKNNDLIYLVGTGAGLSIASILLKL